MRVAIDTGGTFTDCVWWGPDGIRVLKVFSTPADPGLAVMEALAGTGVDGELDLRHGTTVGTNAMLERRGARVAFVTTEGFEDTIAIGRQARSRLYDWFQPPPIPLVPEELRFGLPERVSAERLILRSPAAEELAALRERIAASGAEAIAISLLWAFANPLNERLAEEALRPLGLPISVSHRILPEFREYERASTIAVNAYLAPEMQKYLIGLGRSVAGKYGTDKLRVMQSSGGIVPAQLVVREPVRTVLSGPAGGVIGAYRVARQAGFDRMIGIDMGGTSTDVFLAEASAGGPRLTRESVVAGVPVAIPMLDIHSIGAGGGSIARFDAGGLLRVGPESAGSDPGPICFGKGTSPTVTDANLLLGRLDPQRFIGGTVPLHQERARRLMDQAKGPLPNVQDFAAGILRVIEAQMEKAIRVISMERGHDPRDFTLVAFGGGGPLHACSLARALRIPQVLVPCMPGALSAIGILLADTARDYSRTVMISGERLEQCEEVFRQLEQEGLADFAAEKVDVVAQRSLDLRYRGQGYELDVAYGPESLEAFHCLHEQRYGFCDRQRPVEIVNVRLRLVAAAEPFELPRRSAVPGDGRNALLREQPIVFSGEPVSAAVYDRERLQPGDTIQGPALIVEYSSATLVSPGSQAQVDPWGNLVIQVSPDPAKLGEA